MSLEAWAVGIVLCAAGLVWLGSTLGALVLRAIHYRGS